MFNKIDLVKIFLYDKCLHFIVGFLIFIFSSFFTNNFLSFVIVVFFAVVKELYDYFDYGKFDYKDFLATILPALLIITQYCFERRG